MIDVSNWQNPILPVTDVNHPPPPLSGHPGTFDTIIPGSGGEHLRLTTGADGQQHWAVFAAGVNPSDPNAQPLMSGDITPGQPFNISDGQGLADTISLTNGADGSQDLKFTDAAGQVIGDQVFNAPGQNGYTTTAENGDSVTVTDLGNGLEAVSVTSARTGEVDTSVVAAGSTANSLMLNGDKIDLSWTNGNLASLSISTTDPSSGQSTVDKFDFSSSNGAMTVSESVNGQLVATESMTQNGANWSMSTVDMNGITRTDSIANGIDTATFTDAQGNLISSQTYDSAGALTSTTMYAADGSMQVSTPDGDTKTYGADSNGSYAETKVDSNGNQILSGTMTVDANGNGTYTSTSSSYTIDPASGNAIVSGTIESTQQYDNHGALVESTSKTFDAQHNQLGETTITPNADHTGYTAVQKDASGQIIQTDSTTTSAAGVMTETLTSYDAQHNPVDVKTVSTDAQGRILSQSDTTANYENGVPLVYTSSANSQSIALTGGDAVTKTTDNNGQHFTFSGPGGQALATIDVSSAGYSGKLLNGDPCTVAATGNGGYSVTDQRTGEVFTVNAVDTSGSAVNNSSYSSGYQATISYDSTIAGSYNAAPEQFNFVNGQQPSSFVQQGAVNTLTNAGGWASIDTNSMTYSFGASAGQPQLQVSYDAAGKEWVQYGNQRVEVPATLTSTDGSPQQIHFDNGAVVTYTHSADQSQTFAVGNSTYKIAANHSDVTVNGQQGSLSPTRVQTPATRLASNGFFSAGLFGGGVLKTAVPARPAVPGATNNTANNSNNTGNPSTANDGTSNPDQYLLKEGEEAEEAYSLEDFSESLQDQMMNAGTHVRNTSTINSILRQSYSGNSRPEAVVAATVDQNMATIYCGQGKYGQAEQLYQNALKTMDKYTDAPEYKVLLETYANFLDRQGRRLEGDAYRSKLYALDVRTVSEIVI